jgi:hypothetical protein
MPPPLRRPSLGRARDAAVREARRACTSLVWSGLPPELPVRAGLTRRLGRRSRVTFRQLLGVRGLLDPRRFGLCVSAQPGVDSRAPECLRRASSTSSAAHPPRLSAERARPSLGPLAPVSVETVPRRASDLAPQCRAPSFVGFTTDLAAGPRSRRLFKAPRRSIPERVPSMRLRLAPQQPPRDAARTASRLHRTFFDREPSQASSSSTSPFTRTKQRPPDLSRRRTTSRPLGRFAMDASHRLLQTNPLPGTLRTVRFSLAGGGLG